MPELSWFGCFFSFAVYIIFSAIPLAFIWFIHYLFSNYRRSVLSSQLNNFCEGWLNIPQIKSERKLVSWPNVQTNFNNHPLYVSMRQSGGKKKTTYSYFEMDVSNPNGLKFLLTKENFLSTLRRAAGMQDVETGDFAFDNEFVVKTNYEERLREILNEEVRTLLIERQFVSKGFSLKLEKDKIIYETIGEFESNAFNNEFHRMIVVAAKIADRLKGGSGELPEAVMTPRLQSAATQPERYTSTRSHASESIARTWPDDDGYLKRLSGNLFGGSFTVNKIARYSGQFKNRSLIMEYSHETEPKILRIKLSVIQKFWLRLIPKVGEDEADEIRVSDPWFDRQFRIHSDRSDSAVRFLEATEVTKEFKSIHFFDRFEIHKGVAVFTMYNPRKTGFLHSAFEQTLNRLDRILQIYEQQKLNLLVSALHTDSNTCPYCKEDFDPAVERIVICNYCRTSHHESCLNENQHCTTWGCVATQADFSLRANDKPKSGEQIESN